MTGWFYLSLSDNENNGYGSLSSADEDTASTEINGSDSVSSGQFSAAFPNVYVNQI